MAGTEDRSTRAEDAPLICIRAEALAQELPLLDVAGARGDARVERGGAEPQVVVGEAQRASDRGAIEDETGVVGPTGADERGREQ